MVSEQNGVTGHRVFHNNRYPKISQAIVDALPRTERGAWGFAPTRDWWAACLLELPRECPAKGMLDGDSGAPPLGADHWPRRVVRWIYALHLEGFGPTHARA